MFSTYYYTVSNLVLSYRFYSFSFIIYKNGYGQGRKVDFFYSMLLVSENERKRKKLYTIKIIEFSLPNQFLSFFFHFHYSPMTRMLFDCCAIIKKKELNDKYNQNYLSIIL